MFTTKLTSYTMISAFFWLFMQNIMGWLHHFILLVISSMLIRGTMVFHAWVRSFMRAQHEITGILHLLYALRWENNGIFTTKHDMILASVVLMFADPRFLERFKGLLSLFLDLFNPLWRRKRQEKLTMIGQSTHHILLFLDLAPYVDDLRLQILIRHLHKLPLSCRLVGFLLLIMRG